MRQAASGALLGALVSFAGGQLDLDSLLCNCSHLLLAGMVVGLGIGLTRARIVLPVLASVLIAANVLVIETPLARWLASGWTHCDPPQRCDAVVVLNTTAHGDGTLSAGQQARLDKGLSLLRQGWAPRLVVTHGRRPEESWSTAVRRQMSELGLNFPVDEVGPVSNTHDEAIAVAELMRERHWGRLLLVTEPSHMRRAAAVFEHAGVPVVRQVCAETRYDLGRVPPDDRIEVFRDWLHEWVGLRVYRLRGWL